MQFFQTDTSIDNELGSLDRWNSGGLEQYGNVKLPLTKTIKFFILQTWLNRLFVSFETLVPEFKA